MNPMGLMELAQIKEQEHMQEALRRAALRQARKEAGITWMQLVRARLFGVRGRAAADSSAPAAPVVAPAAPVGAPAAPFHSRTTAAPAPAAPPVVTLVSASATRRPVPPARPAAQLRVVRAPEPDCVGADC